MVFSIFYVLILFITLLLGSSSFDVLLFGSIIYFFFTIISGSYPSSKIYLPLISIAYLILISSFSLTPNCEYIISRLFTYDFSRYFCLNDENFFFGLPLNKAIIYLGISDKFTYFIFIICILYIFYLLSIFQSKFIIQEKNFNNFYGSLLAFSVFFISPSGQYGLVNFSAQFFAFLLSILAKEGLEFFKGFKKLIVLIPISLLIYIHPATTIFFIIINFTSPVLISIGKIKSSLLNFKFNYKQSITIISYIICLSIFVYLAYIYLIPLFFSYFITKQSFDYDFEEILKRAFLFFILWLPLTIIVGNKLKKQSFYKNFSNNSIRLYKLAWVYLVSSIPLIIISFISFNFIPLLSLRFIFYAEWLTLYSSILLLKSNSHYRKELLLFFIMLASISIIFSLNLRSDSLIDIIQIFNF